MNRTIPTNLLDEMRLATASGRYPQLLALLTPRGIMDCPNCNDGVIHVRIYKYADERDPVTGNPERPAWKYARCPICSDGQNAFFPGSGLFPIEYDWRIDHIKGLPGKSDAYRFAAEALAKLPALSGLALISGTYGVGKTGLGRAGVATVCRYGLPARVVTAEQIWNEVVAAVASDEDAQENFGTDDKSKAGILARYAGYRLLVVDEVGSVGGGEKQDAFLRSLYDMRYNKRDTHATWFITNQNLQQLSAQMPYLASRLETGVQVAMGGKSLRSK